MPKQKGTENKNLAQKAQKEVESAARQVAKRNSPPRPQQQVQTDPGDNSKYLRHSMSMWNWQRPDMTDAIAVRDRINQYFTLCDADDMKPSVAGLALAFSADRKTLWRWVNGVECGNITADVRHTLKKAYAILNAQMEEYMQNGKINPVAGIFLMKNNMGYEDKTEMVITPQNAIGEASSPKELAADYVIDVTDQQTGEQ